MSLSKSCLSLMDKAEELDKRINRLQREIDEHQVERSLKKWLLERSKEGVIEKLQDALLEKSTGFSSSRSVRRLKHLCFEVIRLADMISECDSSVGAAEIEIVSLVKRKEVLDKERDELSVRIDVEIKESDDRDDSGE